jgi:hypothetical protein
MKKTAILLDVCAILIFLVWSASRIQLAWQTARNDAYIAGYEQCSNDTFLYLQLHPDCVGISEDMRRYLEREKPSPQTASDMAHLIRDYEKAENVGWHEYWLGNGPYRGGRWQ